MSEHCNRVFGIWACENEEPGHEKHFVDDLTGKQAELYERALDEVVAAMDEKQIQSRLSREPLPEGAVIYYLNTEKTEERHETEVITIPEDGYRGGSDQGWYKAWCICGWESWPAYASDAEDLGIYHEENPNG